MSRAAEVRTLWYSRCPMPTASSVAIVEGWLEQEFAPDGIDVRSLRTVADRAGRLAHYDHASPALFREGGVVPPLWARAGGAGTRLLGVGVECGVRGLMVGPTSDIHEPAALAGRRIALPRRLGGPVDFARAVSWKGITECLRSAGIPADRVELVDVTSDDPYLTAAPPSARASLYTAWENVRLQSAEVLALVRGEVDAVFVSGGYGLELAALTGAVLLVELTARDPWGPFVANHIRVLTVSSALLESRPDLVVRYVGALQRSARWAAEHDSLAVRTVAAELGLAEEWTRLGYHPDTTAQLGLGRSDEDLARLEEWGAFLFDRGFLDAEVDVARWLTPDPLDAALATLDPEKAGSRR